MFKGLFTTIVRMYIQPQDREAANKRWITVIVMTLGWQCAFCGKPDFELPWLAFGRFDHCINILARPAEESTSYNLCMAFL